MTELEGQIVMPRVIRYNDQPPAPTLDEIERAIRAARELDLQAAAQFQSLRRDVMGQTGLSAQEAAQTAETRIGELRDQMLGKATGPRMQAMLDEVIRRRADLVRHEFSAHVEQATAAANLDHAMQRRKLAREDAIEAVTPLSFQTNLRTMLDAIEEHGVLAGHEPGEITATAFRELSKLHADRIARKLDQGDVDGAIALHQEDADRLSASDAARVGALLSEPKAQTASAARVDEIMGAQTRNADAPFSYADPLHGAGRAPISGGRFGAKRTYAGKVGSHKGLDLPAPLGTPVYTSGPGIATVRRTKLGGNIVSVTHADGSVTKYMHLGEVRVKTGDRITPDTIVGTVGTTGRGTGPHLHYEIWQGGKPVDPATLIRKIEQSSREHDVDALIASVRQHPDPAYPIADRERDVLEILRRVRPSAPLAGDPQHLPGDSPPLWSAAPITPAVFDAGSETLGLDNMAMQSGATSELLVDTDPTEDELLQPINLAYNPTEDPASLTADSNEVRLLPVSASSGPAGGQSAPATVLENNGQYDQLNIGTIPGRGAAKYNKHDLLILNLVNRFNRAHGFTPNDPRYLWATLVKAVAIQESSTSPQWDTDTMQVNKKGDWDDTKSALGLTRNVAPDPATSIRAGIEWLYRKGFNTPASDPKQGPKWTGWNYAVQSYNGNGDMVANPSGGVTDNFTGKPITDKVVKFKYVYARNVLDFYESGRKSLPPKFLRGTGRPARGPGTPPQQPKADDPPSPFGPPHIGFRRRMRII